MADLAIQDQDVRDAVLECQNKTPWRKNLDHQRDGFGLPAHYFEPLFYPSMEESHLGLAKKHLDAANGADVNFNARALNFARTYIDTLQRLLILKTP